MPTTPQPTLMGAPSRGRSLAPWLVFVALAGVAATLTTILLMRDKGGTKKASTETIAAAEPGTPDAKVVTDDDRVLDPDEPAAPTEPKAEAKPATVDTEPTQTVRDPDPKPPRDTKRPTTHRTPPKRTGNIDKDPDPPKVEHAEPPKPVETKPDPPKPIETKPEAPKPEETKPPIAKDPPKPVEPPKPTRTPVVAVSAVTKVSGELPAMRVNVGDDAGVTAKLCIDESGNVSSVKLVKAPTSLTGDLTRALSSWKYKPYVNRDSKLSPACFVVSLRLVVK
jgi:hypothetical protein